MKEIVADENLVSMCGLYCGACRRYLNESCLGCAENHKAGWCKVRACCLENKYASCADCKMFADCKNCKKFNNFISKIFQFLFHSDRHACVMRIKAIGRKKFAEEMAAAKLQTIKPRKSS